MSTDVCPMMSRSTLQNPYAGGSRESERRVSRRPRSVFGLLSGAALLSVSLLGGERELIPDGEITLAVESELVSCDEVPSHRIDVETKDGVVGLSGWVNHLLAKRHAKRHVESLKGIRAVVNRLRVRPSGLSDRRIRRNVVDALRNDPATEEYEINLSVNDGQVVLAGSVDSWAERFLAEEVVAGATGVTGIENRIEGASKVRRPDEEIKADIVGRLGASAWIDDGLIEIHVANGDVRLSGYVGSAAEKRRARIKAWVAGVESVSVDDLKVDWSLRDEMRRKSRFVNATDEQIEKAIEDAFRHDPRVFHFNVRVDFSSGVATLTGIVDNLEAKIAAAEDARNTRGVRVVKNHLRVRRDDLPGDEEVRSIAQEVLERDVYVERHEITTRVDNGHLYLYGNVDTGFEKRRAELVVSGVKGVVAVINFLKVDSDDDLASLDDLQIQAEIDERLRRSPYVNPNQVRVSVVDGVATLTGAVDNWRERGTAEGKAREGGARRVINKLKVRSP